MKPRSLPLLLATTLLNFVHRPHNSVFAAAEPASLKNTTFNPLANIQQFPLSSYATNMSRLAPVIAVSHGGGPLPILGDPSHAAIAKSLKKRVPKILKLGTPEQPKAIVLVTAHWSTNKVTVSSGARHELLYDYYGFPDEAYGLEYGAPGSPEVAAEIEKVLKENGIAVKMDGTRGWDHGVFVPMMLINPKANVPIIQLSVLSNESPSEHYALGRALHTLRTQNIAIVGSGFASLHNLRAMFSGATSTPSFKSLNEEWSRQVGDAVSTPDVEERGKKFESWRNWKGAYEMHPRGGAEHFLPLIVCAGAGGEGKGKMYADSYQGLDMWSYYWDGEES